MSTNSGPTVRRRIVASELRRQRMARGQTQQQVEEAVGLKRTALSRYENCTSSMSVPVAKVLFEHYDVTGGRLDSLLDLVKGSRRRGWLKEFRGVVPAWLEDLIALERDASRMHELALKSIPAYLQTEDYARAMLQSGIVGSDVEQRVKARMARTDVLLQESPPAYWSIICESALRCAVGGPDVMRAQLDRLLDFGQKENVTLQVIPDSHGAHPSMGAQFLILEFDIAPDFGVIYLDYATGSLYRDDPAEVTEYHSMYRHLIKTALSEDQSLKFIETTARKLHS